MTDNISRMYELAGVERIYSEFNNGKETVVERVFSPYKQLKLIKWFDFFSYFSTCGTFHLYCHLKDKQYHKIRFVSFEDTLAGLVCELWKDLTPEQREEVRGILQ